MRNQKESDMIVVGKDHIAFDSGPAKDVLHEGTEGRQQLKDAAVDRFALKRLRRKLDILLADFKATGDNKRYDIEECLALVNIIEKGKDARSNNQGYNPAHLGDVAQGQVGSGDSF